MKWLLKMIGIRRVKTNVSTDISQIQWKETEPIEYYVEFMYQEPDFYCWEKDELGSSQCEMQCLICNNQNG